MTQKKKDEAKKTENYNSFLLTSLLSLPRKKIQTTARVTDHTQPHPRCRFVVLSTSAKTIASNPKRKNNTRQNVNPLSGHPSLSLQS